ncbi:MAG: hypothetical protein C1943_19490 [Halochromatium sp.]|nr:hypothetical protein [Halochromatium sp.]
MAKTHGIDLAEIEAFFYDPYAITIEDLEHDEERFVTFGQDHLERQHDEREANHARTL